MTPYVVLANLAAMPVVSAVVMPAGMIGLVAAPANNCAAVVRDF